MTLLNKIFLDAIMKCVIACCVNAYTGCILSWHFLILFDEVYTNFFGT